MWALGQGEQAKGEERSGPPVVNWGMYKRQLAVQEPRNTGWGSGHQDSFGSASSRSSVCCSCECDVQALTSSVCVDVWRAAAHLGSHRLGNTADSRRQ